MLKSPTDRAAMATPVRVARRIKGLSDRAIAWIFVTPHHNNTFINQYFPSDLDYLVKLH